METTTIPRNREDLPKDPMPAGISLKDGLGLFRQALDDKKINSLAPLLAAFTLSGQPVTLRRHYQLAPIFDIEIPQFSVWMVARQLGKSYSIAADGFMLPALIPNFHVGFIQPRHDQIKRFNKTIMAPMIRGCYFKQQLIEHKYEASFQIRPLRNGSNIYMDFCYIDPDRIRGMSGVCGLFLDEYQDLAWDHIPVIREVMSASELFGFTVGTGTPKTTDGTMGKSWELSSQAEWCVVCPACHKDNVPHPDQDLWNMIGDDGLVCSKCARALDTARGRYVHAHPERRWTYPGRHLSQMIHPVHNSTPAKWHMIKDKMHHYPKARLLNEVIGVPCDEAVKLITVKDVRNASIGSNPKLEEAIRLRGRYASVSLGIDWSGGGNLSESYTVIGAIGLLPGGEGRVDNFFLERIPHGVQPEAEAHRVLHLFRALGCDFVGHDYCGAGNLREVMLVQMGMPQGRLFPFSYASMPSRDIISFSPNTENTRMSYMLDKARSLAVMAAAIKAGKLRLVAGGDDLEAPVYDLCNLVEDPRETDRGGTIYLITRAAGRPDDGAHAINYGASAIWYANNIYPDIYDPKYLLNRTQSEDLTNDQLR